MQPWDRLLQEQESREIVLRKTDALHSCFEFSPPFSSGPGDLGANGGVDPAGGLVG